MRVIALLGVVLCGCLGSIEGMDTEVAPPNSDPQAGCAMSCHGADTSNAPPKKAELTFWNRGMGRDQDDADL